MHNQVGRPLQGELQQSGPRSGRKGTNPVGFPLNRFSRYIGPFCDESLPYPTCRVFAEHTISGRPLKTSKFTGVD
jgi:hypothetical protein